MASSYKQKYPHLFEPMFVGKRRVEFKNRVLTPPMSMGGVLADSAGRITEDGVAFFAQLARGGFSSITIPTEVPLDGGHLGMISIDEDIAGFVPMHILQNVLHAYRCRSFLEIYHAGCCMLPGPGRTLMSASAMTYNGRPVKEMDEDDMAEVSAMYVHAAQMARRAGFDGICLHYAHGWLMNQFLSSASNHRTDKYGGSVENRTRFPRRVIEDIRKTVGDSLLIEVRLNTSDKIPGGVEPEEAVETALILEDLVDMIQISCGSRLDATARMYMHPTGFVPMGHNAPGAAMLKRAGVRIPVGVVGSIHTPELAERILAEGQADYVDIGRQANCEPDWVNKVRRGQEKDIRPCIHCDLCLDGGRREALPQGKSLTISAGATFSRHCSVNPLYAQNSHKPMYLPPFLSSRSVVVVGGGIAGMQAALTAARRGHKVILFEKTDQLGGQAILAGRPWFKKRISDFRRYLERQVYQAGVSVLLNTEATPETVRSMAPDAVIVAVGGEQKVPPIPGVDKPHVVMGWSLFTNSDRLGRRVAIIGGGSVGCELSLFLSEKGHEVTVLEMGHYLAANAVLTERMSLLSEMEKYGVSSMVDTRCVEITDTGIVVENEGQHTELPVDNAVICAGMTPLCAQRDMFQNVAFDVINVGDCSGDGGTLCYAVESGWNAASTLE